jgi:hypothetical protein
MKRLYMTLAAIVMGLAGASTSAAEYAGIVKTARGTVTAERGDAKIPLTPGSRVEQADRIVTGTDGLVGITMRDDTLLTLGPRSRLSLDTYAFDAKTHEGTFLASLKHGVLSVVTGLLPRHSPDSFTVKTPISTMGVRGTEFVIEAKE